VELLEDRTLLSVFTVTTVLDNGDNLAPTTGSLRAAILAANASVGFDTIEFNIPGSGVQTILPPAPLPGITDAIHINGYSQPGASRNTLIDGNDAVLLIELDGSQAGFSDGLIVSGGNSTVEGLVIHSFQYDAVNELFGSGIVLNTNGGNRVVGNFIGTDATGTIDLGNGAIGVKVNNVPNNVVGGTNPADRNLLSGNQNGVLIERSLATGNVVQGNFIGTDRTGTLALGNDNNGVAINSASNNAIGPGNVISANLLHGVSITDPSASGRRAMSSGAT
jgi:hypothetical protein